ncbi:MAG TPA: RNA polymerase sigma factor [Ktedonobacteraceae bacterium]|jgi:RNA polymerase sigma-70 factor (ECF subfamily)|nr:RNA polymerase sigma factor [Ktedonobacteraceae bacterium]
MNALENEPQLTIEACKGSMAAFEELVLYYEPRIRRMLYSLTQDVQLTQDLCQETFLAAYRALPRMNGEELHFAPWLYRIALNQVRSEWRRRKHVSWVPFLPPQTGGDESFDEAGEDYLESEECFEEQVVQRDLIERVMAQLPPNSVACLLLDAEGFTYREIAEVLGDTLSAVRSRLSRARHAFQQLYKKLEREAQS